MTIDHDIHRLARHGILNRAQLLAHGITDHEILGRLERGSLRQMHPGVYATFGTPQTYETRLLAACFAAHTWAVASHRSALVLWKLLEGEQPIEVTAPRSSHPEPHGVVVHRPNVLRPQDVTTRGHIPVTNPLRTLLDAGAVLPRREVGECVERALVARLVTVKGLRVILSELGGRGRSGSGALRSHLDARALGDRRPESMIEPLMARLLYGNHGIGPVEYQPTLVLGGLRVRPDFLVTRALVVVETDGLDAHSSREALDRDLARQNHLIRHGYLPLRYTITDLRRPAATMREIVDICRVRICQIERGVA